MAKQAGEKRPTVYFVSLGCPKNRVDTEVMLGATLKRGHEIVSEPEKADVIVVNTCGFIGEAKEESVDTILEMAKLKEQGSLKKLIVTGCLTQRYPKEVAEQIPEIDQIFGSGEVEKVAKALNLRAVKDEERIDVAEEPSYLYDAGTARALSQASHTAYVKIAEGCDRPCAFCIIPKLRGPQRSRTIDDVEAEARQLVARGARELNLVAQDLTKYGDDLEGAAAAGGTDLPRLLRRLCKVDGVKWIRLHYAYPTAVSDELIEVIAGEEKVAKYLDVPFQHVDDLVLKRMRRGHTHKALYTLVDKLRARVPGLVLRTTFLVGHPGETEQSFQALHDFVAHARFERLGVFTFSSEEGTPSHELEERVTKAEAKKRRTAIMRLQRGISKAQQKALVGRELEVLVDGVSDESEYLLQGRWYGQAPEIDGVTFLSAGEEELAVRPGDLVRARVTQYADYDLAAEIVGMVDAAPVKVAGRRRAGAVGLRLPVVAR